MAKAKVGGVVSRGIGKSKLTVKIEGQMTPAQWAEFKERLTGLADRYQLTVKGVRAKRKAVKSKK